jgi:hypothetical protein
MPAWQGIYHRCRLQFHNKSDSAYCNPPIGKSQWCPFFSDSSLHRKLYETWRPSYRFRVMTWPLSIPILVYISRRKRSCRDDGLNLHQSISDLVIAVEHSTTDRMPNDQHIPNRLRVPPGHVLLLQAYSRGTNLNVQTDLPWSVISAWQGQVKRMCSTDNRGPHGAIPINGSPKCGEKYAKWRLSDSRDNTTVGQKQNENQEIKQ